MTLRIRDNVLKPWQIQEMICMYTYIYIYICKCDMLLCCLEKDALWFEKQSEDSILLKYENAKVLL